MTDNDDSFYQDDTDETSFDEEVNDEVKEYDSYDEEEHFEWWFRYGRK